MKWGPGKGFCYLDGQKDVLGLFVSVWGGVFGFLFYFLFSWWCYEKEFVRLKCRKAQVENVPRYDRLSDKQYDFVTPVLRTEVLRILRMKPRAGG